MIFLRLRKPVVFIVLALSLSSLIACARSSKTDDTPAAAVEADGLTSDDLWVDNEVDADNLADQGEDLISLTTLDEAQAKFAAALKLNPNNVRADVWTQMIASMQEIRGLIPRMRPFVESLPDGKRRYREMVENARQNDDPKFRTFMLASRTGDIRTVREFQEWLDRVNLRFDNLRGAISRHKNEEIRLVIPNEILGNERDNALHASIEDKCEPQSFGPIQFQSFDCNEKTSEFLLNRADSEAVIAYLSMLQSYFALMNAYQIDPSVLPQLEKENEPPMAVLTRVGGELREQTVLKSLDLKMQDLAIGVKFIIDQQKVACPSGGYTITNRPGYLFPYGLCTSDIDKTELERASRMIDQVINHLPLTIFSDKTPESFDFDWVRFINEPPKNLRDYAPATDSRDACSTGMSLDPLKEFVTRGSFEDVVKAINSSQDNSESERTLRCEANRKIQSEPSNPGVQQ